MSNMLPVLTRRSPHLLGALRRAGLDEGALQKLDRTFCWTLEHGGEEELDFEREPGASYNPRPARAALILMGDMDVNDPLLLEVAVAATVSPAEARHPEDRVAQRVEATWAGDEEGGLRLVRAAYLLDRLRHLHIAERQGREVEWDRLRHDAGEYAKQTAATAPRASELLRTWCSRNGG